jgi:hypothetical protein
MIAHEREASYSIGLTELENWWFDWTNGMQSSGLFQIHWIIQCTYSNGLGCWLFPTTPDRFALMCRSLWQRPGMLISSNKGERVQITILRTPMRNLNAPHTIAVISGCCWIRTSITLACWLIVVRRSSIRFWATERFLWCAPLSSSAFLIRSSIVQAWCGLLEVNAVVESFFLRSAVRCWL